VTVFRDRLTGRHHALTSKALAHSLSRQGAQHYGSLILSGFVVGRERGLMICKGFMYEEA
jgi:hypothetical protein